MNLKIFILIEMNIFHFYIWIDFDRDKKNSCLLPTSSLCLMMGLFVLSRIFTREIRKKTYHLTNDHVSGSFYVDMYIGLFTKLKDRPPYAENRWYLYQVKSMVEYSN